MIALGESDAFERWLNREPVFQDVTLPDDADEERLLAKVARQAKRQARYERGRVQKVTTMFLEGVGAWASYSTHGIEPHQATTLT